MELTDIQIERYSRHIILQDVGVEGQEKLMAGKVLIVGAGGLGSPVALYLAAAGVGTIGLIDGDIVDITNLQRQVIHFTEDVDKPKVQSSEEKIRQLNPDVKVKAYYELLTNRMLIFDAKSMNFRTSNFRLNKNCPICGEHPEITSLQTYDLPFCEIKQHS